MKYAVGLQYVASTFNTYIYLCGIVNRVRIIRGVGRNMHAYFHQLSVCVCQRGSAHECVSFCVNEHKHVFSKPTVTVSDALDSLPLAEVNAPASW